MCLSSIHTHFVRIYIFQIIGVIRWTFFTFRLFLSSALSFLFYWQPPVAFQTCNDPTFKWFSKFLSCVVRDCSSIVRQAFSNSPTARRHPFCQTIQFEALFWELEMKDIFLLWIILRPPTFKVSSFTRLLELFFYLTITPWIYRFHYHCTITKQLCQLWGIPDYAVWAKFLLTLLWSIWFGMVTTITIKFLKMFRFFPKCFSSCMRSTYVFFLKISFLKRSRLY